MLRPSRLNHVNRAAEISMPPYQNHLFHEAPPSDLLATAVIQAHRQNAIDSSKGTFERQGDACTYAVSRLGDFDAHNAEAGSGLDNAGKTTIVKKILDEDVTSVSPTLGFNIRTIEYEGFKDALTIQSAKLATGDVGGQKTLRSYWRNYFEKTDALIWVVDATDQFRVEDCRAELAGLLLEERLMGASLLVLLNKTDVPGCMSTEDARKDLQLDAIKTHDWKVMPCSAITGENLDEGVRWVVQNAKERLFLY